MGSNHPSPSSSGESPKSPLRSFLETVPLGPRIVFYCVFFLAVVLGGLPWLAYRVDAHWPGLHIEIGPWRAVGGVILAVFLAAYLYCSYQLTWRGRGAYVEFDPPKEFVAEGPYRWCRNPVAACVVGMVFGMAILLSSTGVLLLFLLALPLAHAQVVLLEEPLLHERFGERYEAYVRRVPRWIPRRPREDAS